MDEYDYIDSSEYDEYITSCEQYGIGHGCDENCPLLNRGECPEQEDMKYLLEENEDESEKERMLKDFFKRMSL